MCDSIMSRSAQRSKSSVQDLRILIFVFSVCVDRQVLRDYMTAVKIKQNGFFFSIVKCLSVLLIN